MLSKKREYEVKRIIRHQITPNGTFRFRVQWKGYRAKKYNSWVSEEDMSCTELLEDYKRKHMSNPPAILDPISTVRVNLIPFPPGFDFQDYECAIALSELSEKSDS